jgi:hypothetical protein
MLVLLLLNGCSKLSLGYNHGDWLLRHWINDYASFDVRQEDEIRSEVTAYMRWHRKYALPEYIAFLQDLETLEDKASTLQPGDVVHIRTEIKWLYGFTMTPFIRPAAHVLNTMSSVQIEELCAALADKNRELREELLSGDKQENLATRAKMHIHFAEDLVGGLSDKQERRMREMSLRIPFTTGEYIEHREAKQVDLIALLNAHAGAEQIATHFRHWYEPTSAREQQNMEAYDGAMNDMIAGTYAMLTPDQRDRLRKKIAGYIDDLKKLHTTMEASGSPAG